MNVLKQAWRFTRVMFIIFKFIVVGNLYRLTGGSQAHLTQRYSRQILKILKVNLDVKDAYTKERNYFIVSNHMSYLDILMVAACIPTSFITSVEVKEMPFLGWICKAANCLFVERRNPRQLHQEIRSIADALRSGRNVCVFPEATSSNGEAMKPFKRSLYKTAIQAHKDILPLCLKYKSINHEPVNEFNRDAVCWYGDMKFFPHFWQVMSLSEMTVELSYLEPITYQEDLNAKQATQRSFDQIASCYSDSSPLITSHA